MNKQHKHIRNLELQLKETKDRLQTQEIYYKEKLNTKLISENSDSILENKAIHDIKERVYLAPTPTTVGYPCESCNKIYKYKFSLLRHTIKCNGVSDLQCKVCMKFFKNQHSKYNHIRKVSCVPPPPAPTNDTSIIQPISTTNIIKI
jgi:hypothetical protein